MNRSTTRLDRFISQNSGFSMGDVRLLIAQRRVLLDGVPAHCIRQTVARFTRVELDGIVLRDTQPVYLALHKPAGVVSATKDARHPTVLDLVPHPRKHELHLAGRLDFNTTGLVMLTNDGAWSRRLSAPETKLPKVYEVSVARALNEEYVAAFRAGIHFAYEGITTLPAQLEIRSARTCRLSLVEGKYHQVKRMFGYFGNKVLSLHRVSVGPVMLGGLRAGATRPLTDAELVQCQGWGCVASGTR